MARGHGGTPMRAMHQLPSRAFQVSRQMWGSHFIVLAALRLPLAPSGSSAARHRQTGTTRSCRPRIPSRPVCLSVSLCESLAPSCCGLYFVVKGAPGSFVCRHRRVFWKRGHIRVCEWSEKPVFITLSAPKKPPLKF